VGIAEGVAGVAAIRDEAQERNGQQRMNEFPFFHLHAFPSDLTKRN
jgi:hypothetical protein